MTIMMMVLLLTKSLFPGKTFYLYPVSIRRKGLVPHRSPVLWRRSIEEALDEAEAKLESAKEKQVTTARVYEMLDEFQEKFDTYDPAKQKEILQQVVERVEIDPDANPKKGDAIVKRVRFKCPVSFYRTLPEEAYDVLGINEFNRLETTEYTPDGNSRVDGNHDETVVLLHRSKSS